MQVYVSLVAFITKGFTVLNVFTSIVQNMEKGKQEHSISEEGDIAQSKPKQRGVSCNPFKRRDEKDTSEKCEVPSVGFEPNAANQRPSFVYDPALESSEVVTPISPRALKLFEAIREDEMELVEAQPSTLIDKCEIDKG